VFLVGQVRDTPLVRHDGCVGARLGDDTHTTCVVEVHVGDDDVLDLLRFDAYLAHGFEHLLCVPLQPRVGDSGFFGVDKEGRRVLFETEHQSIHHVDTVRPFDVLVHTRTWWWRAIRLPLHSPYSTARKRLVPSSR